MDYLNVYYLVFADYFISIDCAIITVNRIEKVLGYKREKFMSEPAMGCWEFMGLMP